MSLLSTHIFKNNKKETQTCQINILKPQIVNKEKRNVIACHCALLIWNTLVCCQLYYIHNLIHWNFSILKYW